MAFDKNIGLLIEYEKIDKGIVLEGYPFILKLIFFIDQRINDLRSLQRFDYTSYSVMNKVHSYVINC